LQRLHPIEHEQRALDPDEPGETLTLFPRRTRRRIGIAEKAQRRGDEKIGRSRPGTHTLAVERPAEDARRAAIMVALHFFEPVIDERRFPNAAMRRESENADRRGTSVRLRHPGAVEEGQFFVAAKELPSRGGEMD